MAQWQPPEVSVAPEAKSGGFLDELSRSAYNFVQGGIAGGIGAYVRNSLTITH